MIDIVVDYTYAENEGRLWEQISRYKNDRFKKVLHYEIF